MFKGDARWQSIKTAKSETYSWDANSTYVQSPPYFTGMTMTPSGISSIKGARALAVLGDSITTDRISPAAERGLQKADFNSYGSRRRNHEVMMRGTFANIRIRNAR